MKEKMRNKPLRTLALACAAASLMWPAVQAAPATSTVPETWQAPQPHKGSVAELAQWWQQFGEPALPELLAAAQEASPSVAAASTRLAQAQAQRVAAGAGLAPQLSASAGAQRSRPDLASGVLSTGQGGLLFNWELDVFGGQRAARDAAVARQQGAQAQWHEARVSVAAQLAQGVLALRACEASVAQARADAESRQQSLRLTQVLRQAGFESEANAAQLGAGQAQAQAQVLALQASCEREVKGLVALTGVSEEPLRQRLQARSGQLPEPVGLMVGEVPAQVLQQRPDVFAAERQLEAAAADLSEAQAARWPRISLGGSLGRLQVATQGLTQTGTVWSLGPVQISLPLWDGGQRTARSQAAQAALNEARVAYNAVLRTAVREVEQALVGLRVATQRREQAQQALSHSDTVWKATRALEQQGLASGLALEEARRASLQAQTLVVASHQEQVTAWIDLYRALGGGWSLQQEQ
jgi:multidrug efflux system outer membrane protein